MVDRSDKSTGKNFQNVFYSDFKTNLDVHPGSGMLMKVTNEASVKQALKNLILTNRGERLYQPLVGGNVTASIFEMMDGFAANDLEDTIVTTIRNNEPRVGELQVRVVPIYEMNHFRVEITFSINNSTKLTQFELIITRTR